MGFPYGKQPEVNASVVLPAIANAVAPTLVEGEAVVLSVDLNGTLRTSAGGGGGGGDASAAKQDTQITSLQLLDDVVATAGSAIPTKGNAAVGTDGTNARILKTDTNGELQVDVLSMPTVTVSGSIAAGTAGTASADVVSIQGIASMTPVQVDSELGAAITAGAGMANPTTAPVVAFLASFDGSTWQRVERASDTDAVGTSGNNIRVAAMSYLYNGTTYDRMRGDTTNGLDVDVTRIIPGTSATHLGKAEDAAHASGDTGVMALGVRSASPSDRSAGATDGDYEPLAVNAAGDTTYDRMRGDTTNGLDVDVTRIIPGTSATHLGKAEDADHASGDTGVMALGVRSASPSDRSAGATDGDYEPFAVNAAGAVWTTPTPTTVGGLSLFRSLDLDETEEDVKTSAGQVYGWHYSNRSAGERFLKFYNATAATVTVGTTTPVITIPVAAGVASNVEFSHGIAFSTAICAAVTTGIADNDVGAPGTNDFVLHVFYK